MNTRRIILIVLLTLALLFVVNASVSADEASANTGSADAPSAITSESQMVREKGVAQVHASPDASTRTLAAEPAVQIVVGIVTFLFGALALLPLLISDGEGFTRERV